MNWNSQENKILVEAILSLKNSDEAKRFLRDLMTEGEIREFALRLKTAELLFRGVSYSKIEAETGFSSTTVARVSKWLNGSLGGYKTILNKLTARNVDKTISTGKHHHNPSSFRKGLHLKRT
jgi:TrpR-related protein YerC/YecD